MVDCALSDESNSIDRNPLPEDDILIHSVSFYLTLHLQVKYLQGSASWEERGVRKNNIYNSRLNLKLPLLNKICKFYK